MNLFLNLEPIKKLILSFFFCAFLPIVSAAILSSPCPSYSFEKKIAPADFIQPASSGLIISGGFGMTRNQGTKFHEGVDFKTLRFFKNGDAMDIVKNIMDGEVVYLCRSGNSSYGKYVVIRHCQEGFVVYSLYAHLSYIHKDLYVGEKIYSGSILGIIGNTAVGYQIPKSTSHLHFEIGFKLGEDSFKKWYFNQYKSESEHGVWNGFNLVGSDPLMFLDFHKSLKKVSLEKWAKQLPKAFSVRLSSKKNPYFLKENPKFLEKDSAIEEDLNAWEIDFTWYGQPIAFRRINESIKEIQILKIDDEQCVLAEKYGLIVSSLGRYQPGRLLNRYLYLLYEY